MKCIDKTDEKRKTGKSLHSKTEHKSNNTNHKETKSSNIFWTKLSEM